MQESLTTVRHEMSRQPAESLFVPVSENRQVEVISRPSLSYWQDAWMRLKKDKKALASLAIVLLILSFAFVGPLVWTVDPSAQNLQLISLGPRLSKQAVVVDAFSVPEPKIATDFPPEPNEEVADLKAPAQVREVGEASTNAVEIEWAPVVGAHGYVIYRSEKLPTAREELGLPLGETDLGNQLSYVDQLRVEEREYYYSVVAKNLKGESENYITTKVLPRLVIGHLEAQASDPSANVGDKVLMRSFPLGTDYLGRDMLARLMHGGRVSFFIGFTAPLLYIIFGALYGGIAGFLGRRWDHWMMRFADFVVGLPFLLFMILFSVAFGAGAGQSGIVPMLVALILLSWPATARLVRGQVLQLRELGFTQAARMLGANFFYILLRHMIPNTVGVILVTLTFAIPSAIFTEAFLSFIGMGVAPPTPSWGSMSNEGLKSMFSTPHELLFPSLLIGLTVLAFNLLGDGLRDALDPRMRSRE